MHFSSRFFLFISVVTVFLLSRNMYSVFFWISTTTANKLFVKICSFQPLCHFFFHIPNLLWAIFCVLSFSFLNYFSLLFNLFSKFVFSLLVKVVIFSIACSKVIISLKTFVIRASVPLSNWKLYEVQTFNFENRLRESWPSELVEVYITSCVPTEPQWNKSLSTSSVTLFPPYSVKDQIHSLQNHVLVHLSVDQLLHYFIERKLQEKGSKWSFHDHFRQLKSSRLAGGLPCWPLNFLIRTATVPLLRLLDNRGCFYPAKNVMWIEITKRYIVSGLNRTLLTASCYSLQRFWRTFMEWLNAFLR